MMIPGIQVSFNYRNGKTLLIAAAMMNYRILHFNCKQYLLYFRWILLYDKSLMLDSFVLSKMRLSCWNAKNHFNPSVTSTCNSREYTIIIQKLPRHTRYNKQRILLPGHILNIKEYSLPVKQSSVITLPSIN